MAAEVRSLKCCSLPDKDTTAFLSGMMQAGIDNASELRQALDLALDAAPTWRQTLQHAEVA
jgi:hypothetical protein